LSGNGILIKESRQGTNKRVQFTWRATTTKSSLSHAELLHYRFAFRKGEQRYSLHVDCKTYYIESLATKIAEQLVDITEQILAIRTNQELAVHAMGDN